MRPWPLGKKALFLVVLLGVLDIAQGSFSVVNLFRTQATVNALNAKSYAALYWAGKLKGAAKDQRIAVVFYIYSTTAEERVRLEADVIKAEVEMKRIRESYPAFDSQEREAIATSAREQGKFFQAWLEIRDLVQAGKKSEALQVYNTRLMQATLGRRKIEDELAEIGKERGERLSREAISVVTWGVPVVSIILSFAVLLGAGSFLLIVTSMRRTARQLKGTSDRLALATKGAGVGVWEHDHHTDLIVMDEMVCRIVGVGSEVLEETLADWLSRVHPEDRARLAKEIAAQEADPTKTRAEFQYRILRPDGSVRDVLDSALFQRDAEGRVVNAIGILMDQTAQKQAVIELKKSEDRYRTAFRTAQDAIAINRMSDGRYIECNDSFLEIMGFNREDVLGRSSLDLGIWVDLADRNRILKGLKLSSICRNFEARFRKKNGDVFWGVMSASVMEIDGVPCILSISRDISDRKLAEEQIRNLGFYDPLTGLPNRRLLMDRLQQTLAASIRRRRRGALLFIDVDNFKTLNDTLGHKMGDLLLRELARRLQDSVRDSDTVARLGGDEFVIILEELGDTEEEAACHARVAIAKIQAAARQTYELAERQYQATFSAGIVIYGNREDTADNVLQHADIAMYEAKQSGRNTFHFFAPGLQTAISDRAAAEVELRQAIRLRQFTLHYQPQISEAGVFGVEALIFWNHPVRGLLGADSFISHAEKTWQILPLGDWVIETACRQIATWALLPETAYLDVSVNISARQLLQPEFAERVLSAIHLSGADPRRLTLEITESVIMDDIETIIQKMALLRSHGLRFALDDFGTGYSSLTYLKRLPLDQLKIDRTFVRDMLVDTTSNAIARTVVALGKAMGVSVVAEGVETVEQRDVLADIGCRAFQGYLFSPALPPNQLESWIAAFGLAARES